MERYEIWIKELKEWSPFNHSEALSVFHFMNSKGFATNNDKLLNFFKSCQEYRKESSKIDKEINKKVKENKDITELQDKIKELNSKVGINVEEWMKTFKNNGSGPTNLKKRYNILKKVLE